MRGPLTGWLPTLLVALAALFTGGAIIWRHRFLVVTVDGTSMQPILQPGDRLLVRRTRLDRVRVGQVAVLRHPESSDQIRPSAPADSPAHFMIKRIAAIPGDRVPDSCRVFPANQLPDYVPPGNVIVLGDNPQRSYDSRIAGLIPASLLFGVAIRHLDRSWTQAPAAGWQQP